MDGDFEQVQTIQNGEIKREVAHLIFYDIEHVEGYGESMECDESIKSDMFVRNKANEYGLPIDGTVEEYYAFSKCPTTDRGKSEL